MVDRHCPFLNREDPRCAAHFQVGHLAHAFDHCAGDYASCSSYRELLAERIMRRTAEQRGESRGVSLNVGGRPYAHARRHESAAPIVLTVAAPRWSFTERGLVHADAVGLAAR